MLGLDYSSSEEEPDETNNKVPDSGDMTNEEKRKQNLIVNPFDANNYDLSSSEEEPEETQPKCQRILPKLVPQTNTLRSRTDESSTDSSVENLVQSKISIFSNPFKDEETKELSQLERHVKLSDNKTTVGQPENSTSKKKTICWSYHKYIKCKFGNRCRFLHNDTDFIDTNAIKRSDKPNKKRVGITDSLVPPKRAMKAYYTQQNNN